MHKVRQVRRELSGGTLRVPLARPQVRGVYQVCDANAASVLSGDERGPAGRPGMPSVPYGQVEETAQVSLALPCVRAWSEVFSLSTLSHHKRGAALAFRMS